MGFYTWEKMRFYNIMHGYEKQKDRADSNKSYCYLFLSVEIRAQCTFTFEHRLIRKFKIELKHFVQIVNIV